MAYCHPINRQLEALGAATFGSLDQRQARLARFQEFKNRLNDARTNARAEVAAREKRRAAELQAEGERVAAQEEMRKQAEETQSGVESVEEYRQWKVDEAWDAYVEMTETHPHDLSAIVASLQEVQTALIDLMRCYMPEDPNPMPRTNAMLKEYGSDSDSEDSDYTE